MENITVNKAELLATLQTNKAEHRDQYEEALGKYREALIAELEEKLADAHQGNKVEHHLNLRIPESHLDSFETAIQMLEWEVEETVELDQVDFQRYVQNQWEWARSFASNTASYLAG